MTRKQKLAFVKANWKTKTDEEMGKPIGLDTRSVRALRYCMKLKRKRGRPSFANSDQFAKHTESRFGIDFLEIEWFLTEGGLTATDLIKKFNLGICRERLRQLCSRVGLDHGRYVRSPAWYAVRRGLERYALKTELERGLKTSGTCAGLVKVLGGDAETFFTSRR
jgi:hypothetical protein